MHYNRMLEDNKTGLREYRNWLRNPSYSQTLIDNGMTINNMNDIIHGCNIFW